MSEPERVAVDPYPDERCSAVALRLDEPLIGTASTVIRWVLVEQPGAWGPESLPSSALPGVVAARLQAWARSAGARLLLLRSPTRSVPLRRQCFVVASGPGRAWMRRLTTEHPADLLDLDLDAGFAAGGDGLGEVHDRPLFLVCTHGRHDPCCADLGRPLVRSLVGLEGLWESSHVGGDRFAGNLVCLPHGLYYGRVGPEDCARIVAAYRHGDVDLARYRGRSCYDFVTQAAEWFLRDALAVTAVEAVAPTDRTALGEGRHVVTFAVAALGVHRVVVQVTDVEPARTIACHGKGPARPRAYELVAIEGP